MNEQQKITKLKVRVAERTNSKTGMKFFTYTTFSKNGRRTDLKFRNSVTNAPTKDCFIICAVDDVNINTSGEYPVCWVSAILEIQDAGTFDREKNAAAVLDYFGE